MLTVFTTLVNTSALVLPRDVRERKAATEPGPERRLPRQGRCAPAAGDFEGGRSCGRLLGLKRVKEVCGAVHSALQPFYRGLLHTEQALSYLSLLPAPAH